MGQKSVCIVEVFNIKGFFREICIAKFKKTNFNLPISILTFNFTVT